MKPVRQVRRRRGLKFESLEDRRLMAALHNYAEPADVNADGAVAPLDALIVINQLNVQAGRTQPPAGEGEAARQHYVDVSNDGVVTPLDALIIINRLAPEGAPPPPGTVITPSEVEQLLKRAAAASASEDAVIAVVDRGGRILGIRAEADVLANFAGNDAGLVFAIDGAISKARTAAFFAGATPTADGKLNSVAPLTSRTIRFISQSTITQREVESNPNILDPASKIRGPGFVAPIGIGGHFPPEIFFTPQVDLFAIEHQSRDSRVHPGADNIKGTADDLTLTNRFNVSSAHIPSGVVLEFPESYGFQSKRLVTATSRGIATMPGGIGLFKDGTLVGGIGVFFPGPDGYATFEQNFQPTPPGGTPQTEFERMNAPKALEAEWIAFAAAGGSSGAPGGASVGSLGGVPAVTGYDLPFGRIDLVGITLEVYGPTPTRAHRVMGFQRLQQVGAAVGVGDPNSGDDQVVDPGPDMNPATVADNVFYQMGKTVAEGWLVAPHDSPLGTLTKDDVIKIVNQGIEEANLVRAAIRLDGSGRPGPRTRMVFSVADTDGNVLGVFRMPDATIFSIDVAVAKARNTAYYADPSALVAADQVDDDRDGTNDLPATVTVDGTPLGPALTNRTFRFLAEPRFPTGAERVTSGSFSTLRDQSPSLTPADGNPCSAANVASIVQGIHPCTAENIGEPLPASYFSTDAASVLGFDAFNVSRNFRDPDKLANQNGIVFFPGSTSLYKDGKLVGGFGVSGDGVDQDDVVTASGQVGYAAPESVRSDQFKVRDVRLPFQKFLRNPRG